MTITRKLSNLANYQPPEFESATQKGGKQGSTVAAGL